MNAKQLNAKLGKPFAGLVDDAEKGGVARLKAGEIKTGTAFYRQGEDCIKSGATATESAKWAKKMSSKPSARGKRTEKQLRVSAANAIAKCSAESKQALFEVLAEELGHEI